MRRRNIVLAVVMFVLFFVWVLALSEYAGNTDPTNPPGATSSYTLEDIYNRLDTGADGTQSTFTEPTSGPGSTMYTLNQIMDKAPVADNTDGATKADVACGKKYWSLRTDGSGGSSWGLQTGTAPQYVAKTGQVVSYVTGDDGYYRNGGLPVVVLSWPGSSFGGYNRASFKCYDGTAQFTDNGDGTVTDNLTGLMWTKSAYWPPTPWEMAISESKSSFAGYSDWRMPNINELRSLFDPGLSSPYLPAGHPFTGVQSSLYWSSTTFEDVPTSVYAWAVDLEDGSVDFYVKTEFYLLWRVRGGE
ncbi:MAG: DUF1566 domain-containing protein [Gemmatimonadota bacterium]|nr:MAG: DUF1566 domain-containing protein [Gemmatimonadota bacterium]